MHAVVIAGSISMKMVALIAAGVRYAFENRWLSSAVSMVHAKPCSIWIRGDESVSIGIVRCCIVNCWLPIAEWVTSVWSWLLPVGIHTLGVPSRCGAMSVLA